MNSDSSSYTYSSTTKQALLLELYLDQNLISASKLISSKRKGEDLSEDLFQSVFCYLAEHSEVELIQMNNKGVLYYYVIRLLRNQFSTKSKFQRDYLRSNSTNYIPEIDTDEEEIIIKDELIPLIPYIKSFLNSDAVHWYDKLIFEKYIQEGATLRSVANHTGIPSKSIWNTVKKVRKQIRNYLNQNNIFDKL